jgi:hypothetical protein
VRLSLDEPIEGVEMTAPPSSGPHIPLTTSAGHFLSMQPATDRSAPMDTVWYRGDQFMELYDLMAKDRAACESIMEIFVKEGESGDSDTLIKILDIVERALK